MPPPSKRRRVDVPRTKRPEEVLFDMTARADYLTGFHKRKQARIKHAQEVAAKKEREERVRERREMRQRRKEELEEHIKAVDGAMKKALRDAQARESGQNGEDGEEEDDAWDGVSDDESAPAVQPVDHEDEYIDEDKYTTVTVEAVGISRDGFGKVDGAEEDEDALDEEGDQRTKRGEGAKSKTKTASSKIGKEGRSKKKRKKFRYESKAERKVTKTKERNKNSKMAKERRKG